MGLSAQDFGQFHRAVHGFDPFVWQERLLNDVMAKRRWPSVLDLPTGSGKTTCIDIALFALALDESNAPDNRWCPRRIAMVVDRRLIVDQAAERGRKILGALLTSDDRTVGAVRSALMRLSGDREPVAVYTLRGGIPRDDGWTRTPDQPLVIASTVDQVGSRLLLRGYGVSGGMLPVHAGLLGNDILYLLDEVHLSRPFRQTLSRLSALRSRFAGKGIPARFQFAFLSATPGEIEGERFPETSDVIDSDPRLRPRLEAKKPTRIVEVEGRDQLADRIVREAGSLLDRHRVVAAIVNRVDTALKVASDLRATLEGSADVVLLTGRMRPLDRDDVLSSVVPRVGAGARDRPVDEPAIVVVATQCIEAGADFDFDAIVTESASIDALRQRLGRVDRLGRYVHADGRSRAEAVVVHDRSEREDPLYGVSIAETVRWLKRQKPIDFGYRCLPEAPEAALSPTADSPRLLPAYMDLWSQTAPEPHAAPETALFLHGPKGGPADVQVVWRTDLEESWLELERLPDLIAAIGAIPPSSLEAVSLPFIVARRWLQGQGDNASTGSADLEIKPDAGSEPSDGRGRLAIRWRGDETEVVAASDLKPGDTLVVPSRFGGIDPRSRCFDPTATEEVPDLAERASLLGRGRPLLRLHPRVLRGLDLDLDCDDLDIARRQLRALGVSQDGWKGPWARSLGGGRRSHPIPVRDGETDGWEVLTGERVTLEHLRNSLDLSERDRASVEASVESTTDEELSPFAGTEVELGAHCRHVETLVRDFATRLGFSKALSNDLSLAAWLHDVGKADPRFQRMLRGGGEITYYRDEGRYLAKSETTFRSPSQYRKAQRNSRFPHGARHEVLSLAMIETLLQWIRTKANDLDLVLHLVAAHHGHCRPLAPAVEDTQPVELALPSHESLTFGVVTFKPVSSAHRLHRLDSPLADRFWTLIARYGWLELCWLETILRLADHRASEAEAQA